MKKWVLCLLLLFLVGCATPDNQKDDLEYKVEFVSNAEEAVSSITIRNGDLLDSSILPFPAERDGLTFAGWFGDEAFTQNAEGLKVTKDMKLYGKWVEVFPKEEELALENLVLVTSTHTDLVLPYKAGEFSLIWSSSSKGVISDQGKVTRQAEAVEVEMTAVIVTDNIYERKFVVTVDRYPYEARFDEVFASLEFPEIIEEDVVLNTRFSNGIRGAWSSDKPAIISSYGVVSLTHYVEEVTLTLRLELDKETATSTFVLYTEAMEITLDDPEYFINQLTEKDIDVHTPIMTMEEIRLFNQTVVDTPAANTIFMEEHPTQLTKDEISSKILSYTEIERCEKINSSDHSYYDKTALLAKRNLNAIPEIVNVRYGVTTSDTLLRAYPTYDYADWEMKDLFQKAGFQTGTPLIVYHTSLDQEWYYVRTYHYDGWVHKLSFGFCDRDDFLEYVNPTNFLVVTDDFINIDQRTLSMGSKLPYRGKLTNSYRVAMPRRNASGDLTIREILLDDSAGVSVGYLPYTYANLLKQAYKLVGMNYGWGDMFKKSMDSPTTQAAIYACFGFVMGRNTFNQRAADSFGKSVSDITNTTIQAYPVGTLFYTSDFVLLYLGVDEDGNSWVLHNTSYYDVCKIETLDSYGSSDIAWALGLYFK